MRMTPEQALENAIRLLQAAECETNLQVMERLEGLADSWVRLADILFSVRAME